MDAPVRVENLPEYNRRDGFTAGFSAHGECVNPGLQAVMDIMMTLEDPRAGR